MCDAGTVTSTHKTLDYVKPEDTHDMKLLSDIKLFGGRQKRYTHHSVFTKTEMTFSIYLPPQTLKTRVPVLYWLNDVNHTDEQFSLFSGAQRFAAEHGIALVSCDSQPRGTQLPPPSHGGKDLSSDASFYLSASAKPWDRHFHLYEYLVSELPTVIKASFPVDSRKQSISGHGMGGHAAMMITLKNPEKYLSVSALAPVCSPLESPWGRSVFLQYLGNNPDQWRQFDTCALISQSKHKTHELFIDQGLADAYLLEHLKPGLLQEICTRHQYPVKLRFQPGYDHSYFFIQTFIAEHIEYHANKLLN
jgi:S-formylglutathione hydrolase